MKECRGKTNIWARKALIQVDTKSLYSKNGLHVSKISKLNCITSRQLLAHFI